MKINRLGITGDRLFLNRYTALSKALSERFAHVDVIPTGTYYTKSIAGKLQLLFSRVARRRGTPGAIGNGLIYKTTAGFLNRSAEAAQIVANLKERPDHLLHWHAMYAPLVDGKSSSVPYSIITDYTGALSRKTWPDWSQPTEQLHLEWLACQRQAFQYAVWIFTFSDIVRRSLVEDYGISREKIVVVGHAGSIGSLSTGEKTFGSKKILINASDWRRKGGDIAVESIRLVRKSIPQATLLVVGCAPREPEPGVVYYGHVSPRETLEAMFQEVDIVLSPARCDPLPGLPIEAMNFGVPVVVSDRDGMPEMIDYGKCGSITTLNPVDVAAKVVDLLSDETELRKKSEAARLLVRRKYNWPTISDKIATALTGKPVNQSSLHLIS